MTMAIMRAGRFDLSSPDLMVFPDLPLFKNTIPLF